MGLVAIAFSPIGRAIARRIGGEPKSPDQVGGEVAAEVEALRDEVGALRNQLDEVHNRLDFAERMLAQAKAKEALPGGR